MGSADPPYPSDQLDGRGGWGGVAERKPAIDLSLPWVSKLPFKIHGEQKTRPEISPKNIPGTGGSGLFLKTFAVVVTLDICGATPNLVQNLTPMRKLFWTSYTQHSYYRTHNVSQSKNYFLPFTSTLALTSQPLG